jgi:hypothetical protein
MSLAKTYMDSVLFVNKTSAPSAVEGAWYYNSTDKKMYYYNGSEWEEV